MLLAYPNPQFERKDWLNLNGLWDFEFDDANAGMREKWYAGRQFSRQIEVPYTFESELSGIADSAPHRCFWYSRKFTLPKGWRGRRVLLHFGAVDYSADVYVNGMHAGGHTGGNTAFTLEITDLLRRGEQSLYVRVEERPDDECLPRGKQCWEEKPCAIWYTRSSGIWQSVYLECTGERYIRSSLVYPDIDEGTARFVVRTDAPAADAALDVRVTLRGRPVASALVGLFSETADFTLDIFHKKIFAFSTHGDGLCWSPENPVLFNVEYRLLVGGRETDAVKSYFGMRKIAVEGDEIFLNNHRYTMRLVLDQGYYRGGLLTPAGDECFEKDILLAKSMGFNGCRKHQKVESELFHYYADKLGFLVWGEIANCANFDAAAAAAFQSEWAESVLQRFNHPSIVVWVPLNESWGVPDLRGSAQQRAHAMSVYYQTKMLDPTRPVISNDGWEMVRTDIIGIHNYAHGSEGETARQRKYAEGLRTRAGLIGSPSTDRSIFVEGGGDEGQPILLTEMGGASFGHYGGAAYGYSEVKSEKAFLAFLERIFDAVYASEALRGFCYTQFADVEQEINGLVTEDRVPKAEVAEIAEIVLGRRAAEKQRRDVKPENV